MRFDDSGPVAGKSGHGIQLSNFTCASNTSKRNTQSVYLFLRLVFLASEPLRWGSDSSVGCGATTYNTLVDRCFDAVVHFYV